MVGKDVKQLGSLKPEEKVAIAIDMTDACVRVCRAGIRTRCPDATEIDLNEKLRKRFEWKKRERRREA